MKNKAIFLSIITFSFTIIFFQNCSKEVGFADLPPPNLSLCNGVSCVLDPLTSKNAVTTILIALGDQHNNELIVNGASSQFIAETVIRYTSPVNSPKILLVNDYGNAGESPEDTVYVRDVLLSRYETDFLQETQSGLSASDVNGYDLIWFNNPGHSMHSEKTKQTLLNFKGAVVLQGDDLSRGAGFSLEELTGLKYIDNGASVLCAGVSYHHDNNLEHQYQVTLDNTRIPGANSSILEFQYGNDIDNTEAVRLDLEVLAYAKGGPDVCTELRPAIVRYEKF